jgi:hypothetical protein
MILTVALGACSRAASTGASGAAPTTTARPPVLVVFSSSSGQANNLADPLHNSWPQILFRHSFPLSTVLVNASDLATTIDVATSVELPVALAQHVSVAVIWLGPEGVGTCGPSTTATMYQPALTTLVQPLREAGARVLIGNVPDGIPCADAFNAAVDNVARAQHATVADVASALASTPAVGPGSNVTLDESRAIASAFGSALGG